MPAKPGPRSIWRIELMTTEAAHAAFVQALEEKCDALSAFEVTPGGPWRLEGLSIGEPDAAALQAQLALAASSLGIEPPSARIERLPDIDWLARNRRAFPPIRVGRYFIYGSHYQGGVPPGMTGLVLDASTAFGSGEHPTTRGCLLALDRLARVRRVRRMLDLGCGSGILAIAAARTWHRAALAADIDREAVKMAAANARRNGVVRYVRVRWSDGMGRLAGRRRYDLATANILARPLRKLARSLACAVARGGMLVLSGLLESQAADIIAAYRVQRIILARRIGIDGWQTLIFRRR